ncbi:MAG TPA: hypothetical protein PLK61_04155 [Nitrosomonas sp.]|nr:hypothetical protein [Nitrosomonas sp.]
MKVTISLDFDALKDDIKNEIVNRLIDLDYDKEQIDKLEASFDENIEASFMDATFEIEMDDDEKEIVGCFLVGG